MKNYLKFISVNSALCLVLSGMPLLTAHGEEVQKIVILGDSIASGKTSYSSLLEDCTDVQIQNFAGESYTSGDVLNCFSDETIQKALSEADIILINAGEHDIMDKFLENGHHLMEEFKFEKFLDIFTAQLEDYGFTSEDDLLPYSNQMAADLRTNQKTALENIQQINQQLENYPNAKIIWQTAYNMLDIIETYDQLTTKRQMAYNAIKNPAKTVFTQYVNQPILEFAESHDNCTAVDVYTGFEGKAYQYTNLYELDFNLTFAGQTWIANQIISEAGLQKTGDVLGDSEVNAKDAAAVLVHSAEIGAGNSGNLTDEQKKLADVNQDNKIDAKDAAQILVYAANKGAGRIYHFQKSSENEPTTEESSDSV